MLIQTSRPIDDCRLETWLSYLLSSSAVFKTAEKVALDSANIQILSLVKSSLGWEHLGVHFPMRCCAPALLDLACDRNCKRVDAMDPLRYLLLYKLINIYKFPASSSGSRWLPHSLRLIILLGQMPIKVQQLMTLLPHSAPNPATFLLN